MGRDGSKLFNLITLLQVHYALTTQATLFLTVPNSSIPQGLYTCFSFCLGSFPSAHFIASSFSLFKVSLPQRVLF